MGEARYAYKVVVGKSEGPRFRWEDNIEMNLKEMGISGYGMDATGSG
jgi:hypothetical protein